ncbi:hypothetical protein ACFL1B_01865 [Nanoarchaeota archaeon]
MLELIPGTPEWLDDLEKEITTPYDLAVHLLQGYDASPEEAKAIVDAFICPQLEGLTGAVDGSYIKDIIDDLILTIDVEHETDASGWDGAQDHATYEPGSSQPAWLYWIQAQRIQHGLMHAVQDPFSGNQEDLDSIAASSEYANPLDAISIEEPEIFEATEHPMDTK